VTGDRIEQEATASTGVAAAGVPDAGRGVLVTAVRNEAPFLIEWIAYHRLIGFSRIVVLSNTSDDGTEDVLAALAAAGEIGHYHVDPAPGHSPQYAARIVFEEREGYVDGAWYMWLDADEFLNIHLGQRRLPDLLAGLHGVEGIHLNWRLFGASGHKLFPGRYISRDFPGASRSTFPPNRETKSLFRKTDNIAGFALKPSRRPRLAPDHRLTAADFLSGSGQPLFATTTVTQKWFAGDKSIRTNTVLPVEMGWTLAQINHYSVRTPEFFALKAVRGRGAARDPSKPNDRHTEDYFKSHDRNGKTDLSIAVWEQPVTEEMARLARLPGVAEALQRSKALVQAILAKAAVTASAEPAFAMANPATDLTPPFESEPGVRELYANASVILEYGCGQSTILAAQLRKTITSVESDKARAAAVSAQLADAGCAAAIHLVAIGPADAGGFPTRPRFHQHYHRYALSVWDRPDLGIPDLVRIKGRFRAACLAAVRLRATRPTTVLFDDYEGLPFYFGVEKLARKEATIGRMARFTVTPGPIPPEMLTEVVGWFADPR
jgi:hypothetical protein